ncbi:MAG: hypothetical protein HY681_09815, partial [Chloroflexi bacterium]|nr:hypothetical protein [Chloroflexota bacterium]
MMKSFQMMEEEERSILRWGGLAGILGGVLLILSFLVFVMILVLAGVDLDDPEGYPGIR